MEVLHAAIVSDPRITRRAGWGERKARQPVNRPKHHGNSLYPRSRCMVRDFPSWCHPATSQRCIASILLPSHHRSRARPHLLRNTPRSSTAAIAHATPDIPLRDNDTCPASFQRTTNSPPPPSPRKQLHRPQRRLPRDSPRGLLHTSPACHYPDVRSSWRFVVMHRVVRTWAWGKFIGLGIF